MSVPFDYGLACEPRPTLSPKLRVGSRAPEIFLVLEAPHGGDHKQVKPPNMVCIIRVARNKSARACRNAPPLGGRHGICAGVAVGAKFDLDKNQQAPAPQNKVNLAQRIAKISHQQAIALGAQHPARIGFCTAALLESLLATHLILLRRILLRPILFRRILRVRFLLVFRVFHAGASYFY